MITDNIEEILGYLFDNKELLEQALITTAYSNEYPCKGQSEFQTIGDAVLKACINRITDNNYSFLFLSKTRRTSGFNR